MIDATGSPYSWMKRERGAGDFIGRRRPGLRPVILSALFFRRRDCRSSWTTVPAGIQAAISLAILAVCSGLSGC